MKLSEYLKQKKDQITKKLRINERYERVEYSEYTYWDTLVSFDEVEVIDFDLLMEQIAEFEQEFKDKKEQNA